MAFLAVLLTSSILNAAYFLPILHRAWFRPPPESWPQEHHFGRHETALALLMPPVLTALLALVAGLLAELPFSALEWSRLVAQREFYGP